MVVLIVKTREFVQYTRYYASTNIWGQILISITQYNRNLVKKLSFFPQKSCDGVPIKKRGSNEEEEEEDVRVLVLPYLQMLQRG